MNGLKLQDIIHQDHIYVESNILQRAVSHVCAWKQENWLTVLSYVICFMSNCSVLCEMIKSCLQRRNTSQFNQLTITYDHVSEIRRLK